MEGLETLLNTDEVGKLLTVSPQTVRQWVHQGIIPYIKIGGAVRFKLSDIQRIQNEGLKRHNNKPNTEIEDDLKE